MVWYLVKHKDNFHMYVDW